MIKIEKRKNTTSSVLTPKSWTINLSEGFRSVLHRAKSF